MKAINPAIIIAFLFAWGFLSPSVGSTQEGCKCKFDTTDYTATGTRAACTSITKGGKNCEVRFGATESNQKIIQQVIGVDYESYRNFGFKYTFEYLRALQDRNLERIITPSFIATGIPLFLRSAYLGTPEPYLPIKDLRALDQAVSSYFGKYFDEVSKVFAEKNAEPITRKLGRTFIEVKGVWALGGRKKYLKAVETIEEPIILIPYWMKELFR